MEDVAIETILGTKRDIRPSREACPECHKFAFFPRRIGGNQIAMVCDCGHVDKTAKVELPPKEHYYNRYWTKNDMSLPMPFERMNCSQ